VFGHIVLNLWSHAYIPAKDFEQLSDSIMSLCFIDELEEDVVDGSPNKSSQV
jgi:hypothetical protein